MEKLTGFLHDPLSGLSSDVERLNGECSKNTFLFIVTILSL